MKLTLPTQVGLSYSDVAFMMLVTVSHLSVIQAGACDSFLVSPSTISFVSQFARIVIELSPTTSWRNGVKLRSIMFWNCVCVIAIMHPPLRVLFHRRYLPMFRSDQCPFLPSLQQGPTRLYRNYLRSSSRSSDIRRVSTYRKRHTAPSPCSEEHRQYSRT